ncbi:hypothetical protein GKZ68_00020 [Hymenobacter sp. BRD128]|uniref:hypothetical protein n=1 Tax=Hymenobacter sp. BRD128 TaxID=2675878 RepID=UPI0015634076|nr:hypothetical protein [Hymenobacter sp. BRD128]QKG55168.1 hypothetical protein GKZ68_00020 [Hymenobacter sp. BRD128]
MPPWPPPALVCWLLRWDQPPPARPARAEAPARPRPGAAAADARRILYLASLPRAATIPSPDRAPARAYHWVIGNDPRGWLPVVDPTQRETMLSLGPLRSVWSMPPLTLATSALAVRATTRQAADVLECGSSAGPAPLTLTSRAAGPAHAAHRFFARAYSARRCAAADRRRSCALPFSGSRLGPGRDLTAATLAANQHQTARDPAQCELAHWVRWDAAAVLRHRDGLTAAGMASRGPPAGWCGISTTVPAC